MSMAQAMSGLMSGGPPGGGNIGGTGHAMISGGSPTPSMPPIGGGIGSVMHGGLGGLFGGGSAPMHPALNPQQFGNLPLTI